MPADSRRVNSRHRQRAAALSRRPTPSTASTTSAPPTSRAIARRRLRALAHLAKVQEPLRAPSSGRGLGRRLIDRSDYLYRPRSSSATRARARRRIRWALYALRSSPTTPSAGCRSPRSVEAARLQRVPVASSSTRWPTGWQEAASARRSISASRPALPHEMSALTELTRAASPPPVGRRAVAAGRLARPCESSTGTPSESIRYLTIRPLRNPPSDGAALGARPVFSAVPEYAEAMVASSRARGDPALARSARTRIIAYRGAGEGMRRTPHRAPSHGDLKPQQTRTRSRPRSLTATTTRPTHDPDAMYELPGARGLPAIYRTRAIEVATPASGPVILAANHFSKLDHFLAGAWLRRKIRVPGDSRDVRHEPGARLDLHHGASFGMRGHGDEERARRSPVLPARGCLMSTARAGVGVPARASSANRVPASGGRPWRLRAVVPVAIHGSSGIRLAPLISRRDHPYADVPL